MKKAFLSCLAIAACIFIFSGCSAVNKKSLNIKSDEIQFLKPQKGDTIATIKTTKGTIKVVLYPQYAPKAVENFVTHAKNGYYNGVSFHRVIKDFIIQSGDPTATGMGGESIWKLPFTDEFSDKLHHYTGALSMANSGEDTNGSQFFFVTTDQKSINDELVEKMQTVGWRSEVVNAYKDAGGTPYLDYKNTVFGQVYDGLEVIFNISESKTDKSDKPTKDITIQSIEVSTVE